MALRRKSDDSGCGIHPFFFAAASLLPEVFCVAGWKEMISFATPQLSFIFCLPTNQTARANRFRDLVYFNLFIEGL